MYHHENYKGHQVTVDTRKIGKRYRFTIYIDDQAQPDLDSPADDEPQALEQGISEARRLIDTNRVVKKKVL
jgi:hypothetical protein